MYCGFKTPCNFALWIIIALCFVNGAIWLPIGGVGFGGCNYCYDKIGDTPAKMAAYVANSNVNNTSQGDLGCVAGVYEFMLRLPEEAKKSDARDRFWWACVNSGPMAATVAGAIVLVTSFILMLVFLCTKPPQVEQPDVVKAIPVASPA